MLDADVRRGRVASVCVRARRTCTRPMERRSPLDRHRRGGRDQVATRVSGRPASKRRTGEWAMRARGRYAARFESASSGAPACEEDVVAKRIIGWRVPPYVQNAALRTATTVMETVAVRAERDERLCKRGFVLVRSNAWIEWRAHPQKSALH